MAGIDNKSATFDSPKTPAERASKLQDVKLEQQAIDKVIRELENKRRTESDRKNLEALKKIAAQERKLKLAAIEEEFKLREKEIEEELDTQVRIQKQLALEEDKRNYQAEKRASALQDSADEFGSKIAEALLKSATNLKTQLEGIMKSFVESQESATYGLIGTGRTLHDVTNALGDALGGTGLVKQEAVYKHLTSLINQGIIYNVEQRAFLQTISDDLGGIFNVTNGSMTRLVNLQRQDLTANRMAIRSSLKEFLNQNYETSQYIREGFQGVSDALLEAQSIMTADSAMQLEATVQQWLGSLSSVGLSQNSINSLATAIGQLGSGNISQLSGSSMQNLLVMGASRRGLSYGELLTEGVSGDAANKLMQGIVDYMAEVGKNANNVVKSEYARIFGINVSDLVAASQVANPTQNGIISDDINTLLGKLDNYVSTSQQFDNVLANFIYNWGTGVASSPDNYMMYRVTDILSQAASALVGGISIETSFFGNGISTDLKDILNLAPLVTTIPSLLRSVGDAIGDVKNLGNIGYARLAERTPEGVEIFNKLNGGESRSQYIRASGQIAGFTRTEGLDTSGALIISNTNTSDIVKGAKNSSVDYATENIVEQPEEYYDTTDIYKLLDFSTSTAFSESFGILTDRIQSIDLTAQSTNVGLVGTEGTNSILRSLGDMIASSLGSINESILSLPNYIFETSTSLISSANTVTIGNDLSNVQDMIAASSVNIRNIYHLLYGYFVNGGLNGSDWVSVNDFVSTPGENWNWAAPPVVGTPDIPAPQNTL